MNSYKLRFWTGPTSVDEWADRLEAAGITVTVRGTEHVYVTYTGSDAGGAAHNVAVAYERHHGQRFPLRAR